MDAERGLACSPLVAGLSGVRLSVGAHRIALRGAINSIVGTVILYAPARFANRVLMHSIEPTPRPDVSQRALAQTVASILIVVVARLLGVDLLGIDLTVLIAQPLMIIVLM